MASSQGWSSVDRSATPLDRRCYLIADRVQEGLIDPRATDRGGIL
jgi:hypothetical protein